MKEILIDLREYELSNELNKDLISVDELLNLLEEKIYEIKDLKEEIERLKAPAEESDNYEEMKLAL